MVTAKQKSINRHSYKKRKRNPNLTPKILIKSQENERRQTKRPTKMNPK